MNVGSYKLRLPKSRFVSQSIIFLFYGISMMHFSVNQWSTS